MGSSNIKISNPQIGIYSIRYRDNKGRYTKTLSRANSFQYILKNGALSDKIEIPREIKRVGDKQLFIKEVLSKIYQAEYDRKRREQDKRAEKARKEGKKYKPKPIAEVEEAVGISKKDREGLGRRGIKTEPKYVQYRVNSKELTKRRKKAKKFFKELLEEQGIEVQQLPPVIATTKGSPTPRDKTGRLLKDKKGKEIDWYKHQVSLGLIGKNNTDSSIMLNVVRSVKEYIKRDFKQYRDIMLHAFPRANRIIVRVGAITDIENHPDYLYAEGKLQVLENGDWKYVTGGNKRKNLILTSDDINEGISGELYEKEFKKKFPNRKFKTSDDSIFTFEIDARTNIRSMADSVGFQAATAILKLLNKDLDDEDSVKGSLTSSEIFTKIKLPSEGQSKKNFQHFILYPFITFEFTRLKKNGGSGDE